MKAKIYVGAKKYALYIGRKIVEKTLEFLTLPARFVSKKVQDLKNLTMWGNSVQDGIPTPNAPIEVINVGDRTKNLFDISTSIYHMFYNSSGQYTTAGSVSVSDWIKVKPNTQYTLSGVTPEELNQTIKRVNLFDNNKEWLSQPVAINNYPITFTTSSSTYYVRFSFGQLTIDNVETNIQLKEGTTATSYEPYGYKIPVEVSGTTTDIYLSEPLRKIGEYADTLSVDGTNVTVTRNVANRSISNLIFIETATSTPNVYKQRQSITPFATNIVTAYSEVLSSLDYNLNVSVVNSTPNSFKFSASGSTIYINPNMSLEDWNNYIANNDIRLITPLTTPTTETYTIENPIQLEQGTLTIDTDTTLKPSKIEITGDIDNE